jgi:hypothetical protein
MRPWAAMFLVTFFAAWLGVTQTQEPRQAQKQGTRKGTAQPPLSPVVVIPGDAPSQPPADAAMLFDGKDTSGWRRADGAPTGCKAEGGELVCRTGDGDAVSVARFRDAQIHIEFKVPLMPDQRDQLRGNSGVFIQGCFEMQILDSWDNPTYADGSCGALYGFSPPLVNASRKPGEWQSYDILFRAPQCGSEGEFARPGRVTAFHNGVLIHDDVLLGRRGGGCGFPNVCEPGPLLLQDHSGFPGAPHTEMRFRNIWIRRLVESVETTGGRVR